MLVDFSTLRINDMGSEIYHESTHNSRQRYKLSNALKECTQEEKAWFSYKKHVTGEKIDKIDTK